MNYLIDLDKELLLLINKSWTNGFFDLFFPLITDLHHTNAFKYIFVPGLILFFVVYRKWNGAIFLGGLVSSLALNDFIGGKLIKPFFERPRPPVAGIEVILRAPHFGGFSFTSNHASNMFCAAVFVTAFFPRMRWIMFAYAFLVAYSRVYCGVHYPSDVIFGALVGSLIGFMISRIFLLLRKRVAEKYG
ncbi:MAG: phosphatase PAP2 family protein [Oligoflexia bacterium]|nr:MAG: phosphatase PAP2 family protein [Oligoflexia bacterium]